MAWRPPSTGTVAPVMYEEALDARKAMVLATSLVVPGRPSACVSLHRSRNWNRTKATSEAKNMFQFKSAKICCLHWTAKFWNKKATPKNRVVHRNVQMLKCQTLKWPKTDPGWFSPCWVTPPPTPLPPTPPNSCPHTDMQIQSDGDNTKRVATPFRTTRLKIK